MENKLERIDERLVEGHALVNEERLKRDLKKISFRKYTELIMRHKLISRIDKSIIEWTDGEDNNNEE